METNVTATLAWRNPDKLKKHPRNIPIYTDQKSQDFLNETKNGIVEPVIIGFLDGEETIISGHRRVQAARIHGFKEVRCMIRHDLTDEIEILETLLKCNEQREKTEEIKSRERLVRVEIEKKKAARRQAAALKQGPKSPVRETSSHTGETLENTALSENPGRATDVVAAQDGVSHKTVEAGIQAVQAIDEAEALGDTQTAEEIRDTLNTRGPNAAAKKVRAKKGGGTKTPRVKKGSGVNNKLDFDDKQIDQAFGNLIRLCDRRADALKCKNSPRHKACLAHLNSFIEEFSEWKAERR